MKVLYITNLNYENKSGLYNATINRIVEVNKLKNLDFKIINLRHKDGKYKYILKNLCGKKGKSHELKSIEKGLEIENIYAKRGIINSLVRKIYVNDSERIYLDEIKKRIQNEKFDIIHAHWAYPQGYMAKLMKEKYNIPYVISVHGTDINRLKNCDESLRKKTIETLNSADKVFFVSKALCDVAKNFGYKGENFYISNNGVDEGILKVDLDRILKKEKKSVGFIGNLVDVKGAEYIIPIYRELKKKIDLNYIVIGDGEIKKRLEKEAKLENLEIDFKGKIEFDEVIKVLDKIDVLIVPSKNEGFPCVIIEANARGIYVVGSNVGGIPEAIGEYGSVVELDDNFIANMCDEVFKILQNGYDEKILSRYAETFTWGKIVEKEVKIYYEIKG